VKEAKAMKMPTTFVLLVLLFPLSAPAYADNFQIFEGARQYAAYARVYVQDRLYGYTDMYGRIKIDLPHGNYSGEVDLRGTRRRITFTIDGAGQLKKVNAQ
jgi:hypothetical protein